MVSTRTKNKTAHPGAPVMTEAAKKKQAIKSTRRPKKASKDDTIRQLQARIAALENPDEDEPSKEPLFYKGSSPPLDTEEPSAAEPEIPTELDSDDLPFPGQKRTASGSLPDPRALKRSKAYSTLGDARPTLRNKPAGLKPDWRHTVSKSPAPRQHVSGTFIRSSSSSTSSASSTVHESPPSESDHMSSLLAISPPSTFSTLSPHPPSCGNLVPLIDEKSTVDQGRTNQILPFSLPRVSKDDQGRKQRPGLKDLPQWLRQDFRNLYIRRVIEQVCLSETPWNNPGLPLLQHELNCAYPTHRIRLHSDDAAVMPTLRDLGVFRNQVGNEGVNAVIKYLPRQYERRSLQSQGRAKYIATVLGNSQRPFIWEYFRPGTIPLAGERAYYDEKRRGPFQSEPVLRAFSVYYTSHGIQEQIPSADPGDGCRPIGALALAATAVERGYRMHLSGDYISDGNDFSSSKWHSTTDFYLDKIRNDLDSDNWTSIFQALRDLREARARDEQIQIGAPLVPRQREALLPADPRSSPPPLD